MPKIILNASVPHKRVRFINLFCYRLIGLLFFVSLSILPCQGAEPQNNDLAASICRGVAIAILSKTDVLLQRSTDDVKWSYDQDGTLTIRKSNEKDKIVEHFNFNDNQDCLDQVKRILSIRASTGGDTQKVCDIIVPARDFETTRSSPEMSGGHSQPEWCYQVIQNTKSENPDSSSSIVASSERQRNSCSPFNCPLYTYVCTVHVHVDALKRCAP